jgi:hypothetical protein
MELPCRLGKYELTRQIGERPGRFIRSDTFSDREVAVKLIDQAVLADQSLTKSVANTNEASLAGRLAHRT